MDLMIFGVKAGLTKNMVQCWRGSLDMGAPLERWLDPGCEHDHAC